MARRMVSLTAAQKRVFDAIVSLISGRTGHSPSFAEIAALTGHASSATIIKHVHNLAEERPDQYHPWPQPLHHRAARSGRGRLPALRQGEGSGSMTRALIQLQSDTEDAMNHAGFALTHAGMALCDVFVVVGILAGVTWALLARRREPNQNVRKILSDPVRRAREAGL
jgi:hypothetical protein